MMARVPVDVAVAVAVAVVVIVVVVVAVVMVAGRWPSECRTSLSTPRIEASSTCHMISDETSSDEDQMISDKSQGEAKRRG